MFEIVLFFGSKVPLFIAVTRFFKDSLIRRNTLLEFTMGFDCSCDGNNVCNEFRSKATEVVWAVVNNTVPL